MEPQGGRFSESITGGTWEWNYHGWGEGDVGGTSQAPEASLPTLQAPPPTLCILGQGFHPDLLEPSKGRERPESEGREQRERETHACSLICKGAERVKDVPERDAHQVRSVGRWGGAGSQAKRESGTGCWKGRAMKEIDQGGKERLHF